jgi:hypothetical protein
MMIPQEFFSRRHIIYTWTRGISHFEFQSLGFLGETVAVVFVFGFFDKGGDKVVGGSRLKIKELARSGFVRRCCECERLEGYLTSVFRFGGFRGTSSPTNNLRK